MSALLSPEQRETLTRLSAQADAYVVECRPIEYGAQSAGAVTDALRAALVERTCGTCKYWDPDQVVPGDHARTGRCAAKAYGQRDADDGCIKGWTTRQTEMTP